MKFYIVIAICLNLKLWINKKIVCKLQGQENWAHFYIMEAKKLQIFSFFYLLENWLKYFFFLVPTRKILWYLSTTYQNFIKI